MLLVKMVQTSNFVSEGFCVLIVGVTLANHSDLSRAAGAIVSLLAYAALQLVCWYADKRCASTRELPVNTDSDKIYREEQGRSVLVPKVYKSKFTEQNARKGVTMADVAKHNTRNDAWICVEGRAYDVTEYVERHPGGWLPISNLAGKDVTDAFANYHPASVYEKLLPSFFVGEIEDYKVSSFVTEHREIRQVGRVDDALPDFYFSHGAIESHVLYHCAGAVAEGAIQDTAIILHEVGNMVPFPVQ